MNLSHDASQEIESLKQCQNHANIVKFIEHIEDSNFKYVIFEYLSGGELFSRIRDRSFFSEDDARKYFRQLVDAIKFMHENGIVHRDLKPENIMFDGEKISSLKIVDFGFARLKTSEETQPCYTLDYAAPESLSKGTNKESRDIWALGAILYTMLVGHTPFMPQNVSKQNEESKYRKIQMENICQGKFNRDAPQWNKISRGAQTLISKMLKVNEAERLSLKDVFNDKWLFGEFENRKNVKREQKTNGKSFPEKPKILSDEPITIDDDDDDSLDCPSKEVVREEVSSNDSSGIVLSDRNETSSLSSHVDEHTMAGSHLLLEPQILPEDLSAKSKHEKKKQTPKEMRKLKVASKNVKQEIIADPLPVYTNELSTIVSTEQNENFKGFEETERIDIGACTFVISTFDEAFDAGDFKSSIPQVVSPRKRGRRKKLKIEPVDEHLSEEPPLRVTRSMMPRKPTQTIVQVKQEVRQTRKRKLKDESIPEVSRHHLQPPISLISLKSEVTKMPAVVSSTNVFKAPQVLMQPPKKRLGRPRKIASKPTAKPKERRSLRSHHPIITTTPNTQPLILDRRTYYRSTSPPTVTFYEYRAKRLKMMNNSQ